MSTIRNTALGAFLALWPVLPAQAAKAITLESINSATFDEKRLRAVDAGTADPLIIKVQVLLDRHHASPGVIDGRLGENVAKALRNFEEMRGLDVSGKLSQKAWDELDGDRSGDVFKRHKITGEDLEGPFLGDIPGDFKKMAALERLAFRTPAEMFAERFHMDLDLLKRLNPDIGTASAGTEIIVADVGERAKGAVKTIRVDKARAQLRGLDADGKILVAYPATVGSNALPSPSGTHKVKAIASDAAYYYNPSENFKVDGIEEKLTLPPGPNNPIGTTWIDLSEPTYGIHGTPEPADIDKEASHGCVRLTNWDVEELADLVAPGVEVIFAE